MCPRIRNDGTASYPTAFHIPGIHITVCYLTALRIIYNVDFILMGLVGMRSSRWCTTALFFQCDCSDIGIMHRNATAPDALLPYICAQLYIILWPSCLVG